ncbi:relaxase/mobilization nuclease domain-containing protein [Stenoxybacter acetivorans]|uniref:relaxase/mobilization nuclease domain-containing protein n=1 Tax=Stenoxybacter acetivorans TaxID=422441 RepID=UPI00068C141E|nr:traS protein [Stenoxybacter acetivorans]
MSIHDYVDNWIMFKTRTVRAKSSGGFSLGNRNSSSKTPLKKGTGLANLRAAALKQPEVMVKIPRRKSGNSTGLKGVRSHLEYISRNGKVEVETKDGEKLNGKKEVQSIAETWQKHGIPEDSRRREALNIVLSMPPGTPPQAVKDAAREFAKEQFPNNDYAFALHTDADDPNEPAHPHVHLCVVLRNEFGRYLNPRKNDLFEWRMRFAEKMREQGVECAATRRQHRGVSRKGENSVLRVMRQDAERAENFERQQKRQPNVYKQAATEIGKALANQERPKHPYLKKVLETRGFIVGEYGLIAKELYKQGYKTEAREISKLARSVAAADYDTRAQQEYDNINNAVSHAQQAKAKEVFRQPEPMKTPQPPVEQDADFER